MRRRDFFHRTGLALGGLPLLGSAPILDSTPAPDSPPDVATRSPNLGRWDEVRDQFPLVRDRIHMASFLLASHPRPVAEAIERHRQGFDADPVTYWEDHFLTAEPQVTAAAAEYLQTDPALIGLTDSTTMGLGLVYGGLQLQPGDEILTTPHDHWSTFEALRLRAERTGASVRRVPLYDDPADTTVGGVVDRILDGITDRTRVLAVTWVHSSTGVKLPIAAMAEALREVNAARDLPDRVLFCVDGVHGFGIDDITAESLGCDVFIAGTHKWMFGPRGTGLVWARPEAWDRLDLVIPSFGPAVGVWIGALPDDTPFITPGNSFTPGGFHSFDHRWALGEAFRFHLEIGKARIQERIHTLNSRAKEALAGIPSVTIHTPRAPELSAGIICFEVDGHAPGAVVAHLHERHIIASTSPYRVSYPRLAPSLMNDEDEVDQSVAAIAALS